MYFWMSEAKGLSIRGDLSLIELEFELTFDMDYGPGCILKYYV